jgi:hypothetical protein
MTNENQAGQRDPARLSILERELLDSLARGTAEPEAVFLLGSPRTGSTVIYQATAEVFGLPFIANLTNDFFADTPIVGLALQRAVPVPISWTSQFGKTQGLFQPSEGSAVMASWFGGGHPSQVVSATILPGREGHFLRTLAAVRALNDGPLLVKNAWNCFRVEYLARAVHNARFLWIRRDIADASISELESRYLTKGSPAAWTSATPANYESLLARPPAEQVVENQYEYGRAISNALDTHARGRFAELWYEDFLARPVETLLQAGSALGLTPDRSPDVRIRAPESRRQLGHKDAEAIRTYVSSQGSRLAPYRYQQRTKTHASWN